MDQILRSLTPIQCHVLEHLVETDRREDACRALGIGASTFEAHLAQIYQRLGVRNRLKAAVLWDRFRRAGGELPPLPAVRTNTGPKGISEAVQAYIEANPGRTRAQIAAGVPFDAQQVGAALTSLSRNGRAHCLGKDGRPVWYAGSERERRAAAPRVASVWELGAGL
jgi:DNA-binding CsgD family transcriptional regulator